MSLTKEHSTGVTLRVYGWTLFATVLWLSAIFSAPILKSRMPMLSGIIYLGFSPTCHQLPDRCFHILGSPMAVCARCFGAYLGFFFRFAVFSAGNKADFKTPAIRPYVSRFFHPDRHGYCS